MEQDWLDAIVTKDLPISAIMNLDEQGKTSLQALVKTLKHRAMIGNRMYKF